MNDYSFEQCYLGKKEEFTENINEDKMLSFRNITKDINPLHLDKKYANDKGYPEPVVYGLLTSSFFSTLVGVYMPGKKCLIQEVSYKYINPAYVGDEIVVSGEIVDRDDRTRQLWLKVKIRRKKDNLMLVCGKMIVGVLE